MPIAIQSTLPECPFYRDHQPRPREIRCEGVIDRSDTAAVFGSKELRNDYYRLMCCRHYKRCKIYAGICMARYENGSNAAGMER